LPLTPGFPERGEELHGMFLGQIALFFRENS